ncbi:MAG: RNA polymerase sigma factor [Caldilineaceae bacterium]|nr:RNA polymerase sigma factor [Caldilineaceae bacterium]
MFTHKGSSEDDLLRRLQQGDQTAWVELVSGELGKRLYSYMRHKLPTEQDVEEVVQETFSAAVRAIPNFDGRVKLSTFLFSLAQHKLADFWRRHPDMEELPETLIDPGVNQDSIEFLEILHRLKAEHRQVLLMRYHIGLGVDEIASILGKTYRGAESLLSRARAELRRSMNLDDE